MDVSGGSGQPRSGKDKPAEHPAGPTAPTTDRTGHAGPEPEPATPTADHIRAESDNKGHAADRPAAPRPAQADADTTANPESTDRTAAGPDATAPPEGTGSSVPPQSTDGVDHGPDATAPARTDDTGAARGSGPTVPPAGTAATERGSDTDRTDGDPADTGNARADIGETGTSSPGTGSANSAGTEGSPRTTGTGEGTGADGGTRDSQATGTGVTTGDTGGSKTPSREATVPPDTPDPSDVPGNAPGPGTAPDEQHRTLAHSGIAKGEPPQPRPKEPGGGILMGRPFGVPVYVAPSWFLVAALITWVFGGQLDRVLPELGAARYLVSLFFAVAFYASVLVHELAHTVAAIRFKLPVRRIQLQFFGGVSEIEKEAETPGREFVLAFVGPLLSLVLAGLFYLAMKPVEPGTVPGVLLAGLMISNLIVAIFNLLPGLPLDGGRMLRAVVWAITGKPMSGTVAAAWVGRALAVAVLIGLPLLNHSGALGGSGEDTGGMDTVTDALLAAILAAIIWTGAGNSLRMARLREHLPELRARTLTRRAVPVETNTPLSEALRRANAAGARALVVVDAHGNPISLVRESAIVGVPEHRRPWVAVSGLAQELTDGMRVSAELAGEELLDVLRATPATEYLVVEETGEIYGVLSAADVERAFVKAMARPAS
ncbi:site-2 protease family protein [Streptomyces sp. JA03]|nr:site-2 protease family protein [Streptomyces barringtoniae]MCC5475094.1 site-2 protease family protein [Streptomyces barringtoniae]